MNDDDNHDIEGQMIKGLSDDPMTLAQHTRDPQAAALVGALGHYEEEFNTEHGENGWDWPLLLIMIYRSLPPTRLADMLGEVLGGQALLLAFKFFNLTEIEVNTEPDGIPLHQFLAWFAEMLRADSDTGREAMRHDLAEGGPDVVGWGLHMEGYGVSLKPGEEHPEGRFKDVPGRFEQRIIMAVDRAGYRYSITRTRGTEKVSAALDTDTDKDADVRLGGRILDGLMEIMAVTPDET